MVDAVVNSEVDAGADNVAADIKERNEHDQENTNRLLLTLYL